MHRDRQLIEALRKERLPGINCRLTAEEIIRGFKVRREFTSTSPSGRTLSAYKALFAPAGKDARNLEANIGDEVAEVLATLLNLCAHHGLALDRWLTVYNTMLEKVIGLDRIDKVRVIHIMEANLNLLMGILFGRRFSQNAEKHGRNSEYQWGASKGRQCIDVVLLKQLTYEISRLTRTSSATMDIDAAACFDRMVMCFTMHHAQQLGMPVNCCKMMGAFLDNVENHIKTKLGVSKESYKSTLENPLHGPGQGSKAGPDLWKYVSSILMDVLDEVNPGLEYTDPEQEHTSKRPIDGFVDDVTVWAAQFLNELIALARDKYNDDLAVTILKQLVTQTERLAQHWEELLWTSGGKLELTK